VTGAESPGCRGPLIQIITFFMNFLICLRMPLSIQRPACYDLVGRKSKRDRDVVPLGIFSRSPLSPSRLLGRQLGPFHSRPRKPTAGRRASLQELTVSRKLYVGNLTYQVSESETRSITDAVSQ